MIRFKVIQIEDVIWNILLNEEPPFELLKSNRLKLIGLLVFSSLLFSISSNKNANQI